MTIELTDDGTMDTVLRCTECGEEFRFSGPDYEPGMEPKTTDEAVDARDTWIGEIIAEVTDEHECDFNAERDTDEEY